MRRRAKLSIAAGAAALAVAGGVMGVHEAHRATATQAIEAPLAHVPGPGGTYTPVSAFQPRVPKGARVDHFTLTAEYRTLTLGGEPVRAMTFNGTAPGPLLVAHQGDVMEVTVRNRLSVPLTIHWHGIPVPGAEDGVPGVTQNPIPPRGSYTYEFVATEAGTYWYHSHEASFEEVGLGLYGAIVVLPKHPLYPAQRDYTLVLHEWPNASTAKAMMANLASGARDVGSMSGMMSGGMMNGAGSTGGMGMMKSPAGNETRTSMLHVLPGPALRTGTFAPTADDYAALDEMAGMYGAFTVNQNADGTTVLPAKPGDLVRLRIVNSGNMTHLLTIVGAPFRVVALDGHDIANPGWLKGVLLPIGAAERYDVEFRVPPSGAAYLVSADPDATARQELRAAIGDPGAWASFPGISAAAIEREPWFDFTDYGRGRLPGETVFRLHETYQVRYDMKLTVGMSQTGMVYAINGRVFPNIPPIIVHKGDAVLVHIVNDSPYIHPMHLHGHDFQVLTRDGRPVQGSLIFLDTLNVFPGESYDIAFRADNPGLWMFHCHDLEHAASGMDVMVQYAGVTDPYPMNEMSE
ncbi:multicopper oxidase family protein [Alicyclobacillus sendaiensis]|uniref:Multicopper oxidase family protein n=1 Tax=Alicyclobacillus sendaiensis PA2 TaxID=3029425 RepID=A0ABT6XZM0_ALISE|nr:multicopper oxidase family protein [Alicyclobacillus sendaiensis]MDI9260430.1 multicopper oxidase family protein [Alicyclobacillus sendaiensis PA2]